MTNLVIFRGRLRALLSVFIINFCIELRCEWVYTKNLEFFNGVLLHSSVAIETCFGQLGLYPENCDSYSFKCNSI